MVFTEGKYAGGFILAEAPGTISRDAVTVTVTASTTLAPGSVLGRITSSGKFVPYNNDATPATDGSQTAAGILYGELKNDALAPADFAGVIVNWTAEVRGADLTWFGSDESAGRAHLATRGVKVRS